MHPEAQPDRGTRHPFALALTIMAVGLVALLALIFAVDRSGAAEGTSHGAAAGHDAQATAKPAPATAASASGEEGAPAEDGSYAAAGDAGEASTTDRYVAVDEDDTLIEPKPFDPRTAPVEPGPKTFDLVATERRFKIGDNEYELWTFNDTVPGPTLRVVVGDKVTINLTNEGDSVLPHSVDFHSSRISPTRAFASIQPGKSISYTFTAEYPGVFMYHCGTPPVLQHIGMGMYGMMIVQPKGGWQPAMQEYAFVQSELYASYEDMQNGRPDVTAFNGQPNQYVANPIHVTGKAGDKPKVRAFVLNAGPSELSSWHVVGTVFDRVYAEGDPRNVTYARQALAIPASGGGVFEFELVENGSYPFVTHQFDQAGKGGIGLFHLGPQTPGEPEHH